MLSGKNAGLLLHFLSNMCSFNCCRGLLLLTAGVVSYDLPARERIRVAALREHFDANKDFLLMKKTYSSLQSQVASCQAELAQLSQDHNQVKSAYVRPLRLYLGLVESSRSLGVEGRA